jgi:hypothetical protein
MKTILDPFINTSKEWIEYVVFVGYFELIVFISFFFSKEHGRRFKFFILTVIGAFFLLSLGTTSVVSPYSYLFKIMPFRGIVEPGRFYIIFYLVMTSAILLFLKQFLHDLGRFAFILILVFLIIERFPTAFYQSDTHKNDQFITPIVDAAPTAVLDLPVFTDWYYGNMYDLYSIYYQKPIVNGYIQWSGNTKDAQYFINTYLDRFVCLKDKPLSSSALTPEEKSSEIGKNAVLIKDLKSYGIKLFVVHKDFMYKEPNCALVLEKLRVLFFSSGIDFKELYQDENKSVYELNR